LSRCFWPIGEAAQADYGFSSAWLLNLLERKPRKLAAVALANKIVLRERAGTVRVRNGKGLKEREVPLNATPAAPCANCSNRSLRRSPKPRCSGRVTARPCRCARLRRTGRFADAPERIPHEAIVHLAGQIGILVPWG
jgi:hypothetical protein